MSALRLVVTYPCGYGRCVSQEVTIHRSNTALLCSMSNIANVQIMLLKMMHILSVCPFVRLSVVGSS